jgi:hypothetical protein
MGAVDESSLGWCRQCPRILERRSCSTECSPAAAQHRMLSCCSAAAGVYGKNGTRGIGPRVVTALAAQVKSQPAHSLYAAS